MRQSKTVTVQQTAESPALLALKTVHSLIWFSVEASMKFVLYSLHLRNLRRLRVSAPSVSAGRGTGR